MSESDNNLNRPQDEISYEESPVFDSDSGGASVQEFASPSVPAGASYSPPVYGVPVGEAYAPPVYGVPAGTGYSPPGYGVPVNNYYGCQPYYQNPPYFVNPCKDGVPYSGWSSIGIVLLALLASSIAGLILVSIMAVVLVIDEVKRSGDINSLLSQELCFSSYSIVAGMVVVLLLAVFIRRRKLSITEYMNLRIPGKSEVIVSVIAVLMCFAFEMLLMQVVGEDGFSSSGKEITLSWEYFPISILGICIAAPINEEFLFRGFLFKGLRNSGVSAIATIIVTAGFWALLHLQYNVWGMFYIFGMGIVMGWLRERYQSISGPILVHIINNGVACLLSLEGVF